MWLLLDSQVKLETWDSKLSHATERSEWMFEEEENKHKHELYGND